MAKLLHFKSRRRIEEEASVWLSRMDRGLDGASQSTLQAWLTQDPRHARALIAMAALWDEMDLLRELSGLLELPAAERPAVKRAVWLWAGAGLAVPAAVVTAFLVLQRPGFPVDVGADTRPAVAGSGAPTRPSLPTELPASLAQVYSTDVGGRHTETLPDGSIVQLNTASRVEVSFGAGERRVEVVRGEAHFEVKHDASRPFIVAAGTRRIRAVGTAFNVRLERNGRLEVTVTEGKIVVTAPSSAPATRTSDAGPQVTQVAAGEQLLADEADSQWRVQRLLQETLSSRLAWQRGMLVFDGEPLEAALAEVSRYTDVRFEIRDDAIRGMRVGGFYKSGDIDGLVRSLEQNLHIVASREPDGRIVLSAR